MSTIKFIYFINFNRYIQIDIDDIFVGQTGFRFLKNDVQNLLKTQKEMRNYIEDFCFTLGFSGYFFRHGDELEIQGDEELVGLFFFELNIFKKMKKIFLANAENFLWFPHMWRHNHPHEYSSEYLLALMTQNKLFARVKNC